jgi:hypothetical protein
MQRRSRSAAGTPRWPKKPRTRVSLRRQLVRLGVISGGVFLVVGVVFAMTHTDQEARLLGGPPAMQVDRHWSGPSPRVDRQGAASESGGASQVDRSRELKVLASFARPFFSASSSTGRATKTLHVAGPSLRSARSIVANTPALLGPAKVSSASRWATALWYHTDIFHRASKRRSVRGYARRGARLAVTRYVRAAGCKGGGWYELKSGGYICTKKGFVVADKPKDPADYKLHYVRPRLDKALPFDYAKVTDKRALRLFRIPETKEAAAIAEQQKELGENDNGQDWPEVVDRQMNGAFFVALEDDDVVTSKKRYVQTVYGRYVSAKTLEARPLSTMHGELLGKKTPL